MIAFVTFSGGDQSREDVSLLSPCSRHCHPLLLSPTPPLTPSLAPHSSVADDLIKFGKFLLLPYLVDNILVFRAFDENNKAIRYLYLEKTCAKSKTNKKKNA